MLRKKSDPEKKEEKKAPEPKPEEKTPSKVGARRTAIGFFATRGVRRSHLAAPEPRFCALRALDVMWHRLVAVHEAPALTSRGIGRDCRAAYLFSKRPLAAAREAPSHRAANIILSA